MSDDLKLSISFDINCEVLTPEKETQLWTGVALMLAAVMTEPELGEFMEHMNKRRAEIAADPTAQPKPFVFEVTRTKKELVEA